MSVDVIVEENLGKTRYRITENPTRQILQITRYAVDNTVTGTFWVPRSLLVAYARQIIIEKITEVFR